MFFTLVLALAAAPSSDPTPAPSEPGISDNSFLLEEAYNQDFGVVQHISSFTRLGPDNWAFSFAQEWPVPGIKHQLSFSLLALQTSGTSTGVGDAAINYRYQALNAWHGSVSFAPRLSLLVPTGDAAQGLGAGGVGVQTGLPVSVTLGRWFAAHTNLGATWIPGEEDEAGDRASSWGWSAGQSLVWLTRPRFNVLLELSWIRARVVTGPGTSTTADALLLSPGIRWAYNFANGLQIVPGLAAPIGLGPSHGEWGVLVYLSFEHPFRHTAKSRAP